MNKMATKNKTPKDNFNATSHKTDVICRYLIYADGYITWNEKIKEWNYNDEFTGTFLDAHEYARKKYGKKYVIHNGI